jgi:hypothetical protein
MTDLECLEKKAQIKILSLMLEYLCNAELSEVGRVAVKRMRQRLINELDETDNSKKQTPASR